MEAINLIFNALNLLVVFWLFLDLFQVVTI